MCLGYLGKMFFPVVSTALQEGLFSMKYLLYTVHTRASDCFSCFHVISLSVHLQSLLLMHWKHYYLWDEVLRCRFDINMAVLQDRCVFHIYMCLFQKTTWKNYIFLFVKVHCFPDVFLWSHFGLEKLGRSPEQGNAYINFFYVCQFLYNPKFRALMKTWG